MTKVYEYRAIKKGTLSNPFRFVEEGEIFKSNNPMKGSWFIPAGDPLPTKSDILVPYMKIDGRVKIPVHDEVKTANELPNKGIHPKIADPQYDQSMEALRAAEAKMDAIADKVEGEYNPETDVMPEVEAVDKKENKGGIIAPEGTGNQEVI